MGIEIFTAPDSERCELAKEFLDGLGVGYIERSVSDPKVMAVFIKRMPEGTPLPQLFLNGEHLGGYQDLLKILGSLTEENDT